MMTEPVQSLPLDSRLEGYLIEQRLGGGGFSNVYLARDLACGRLVVIKEFFPARLAARVGPRILAKSPHHDRMFQQARRLFFQEASLLASLDHPNIAHIMRLFTANGTIYAVMAFEQGETLHQHLKRHTGKPHERFLRTLFCAVLDGLSVMHSRGLLHLDIKPGNIYLRQGKTPQLLDFGAAHKLVHESNAPATVISPGYSPIEQSSRGTLGPWTDIYALGATLRTCLDGEPPPPARTRAERDGLVPAAVAFRGRYSAELLGAIDAAMAPDPRTRPRSAAALRAALDLPATGSLALRLRRLFAPT